MTSSPQPFSRWTRLRARRGCGAEDRRDFERHLTTCPACAAAVAELAGLPGILAVLPGAENAVALTETGAPGSRFPADEHLRAAMHQAHWCCGELAGAAAGAPGAPGSAWPWPAPPSPPFSWAAGSSVPR